MFSDRLRPPAWFRRHIADQAARRRYSKCRTITAIQGYHTLIGIEVRDGAQQQGLACAGRPFDRNTFGRRQGEGGALENARVEIANLKHRRH